MPPAPEKTAERRAHRRAPAVQPRRGAGPVPGLDHQRAAAGDPAAPDRLPRRPAHPAGAGGAATTDPVGVLPRLPVRAHRAHCGGEETGATVTVSYGGESVEIPVEDETQVVGRWSKERCEERAIERIAALEWSPGIRIQGSGSDAVALFRLTAARPAGPAPSRSTPSPAPRCTRRPTATSGPWARRSPAPAATRPSSSGPARPVRRHSFGSATGGTTFFVNVTIGGEPAQVRLAMSPAVTDEAFAYAAEACGF